MSNKTVQDTYRDLPTTVEFWVDPTTTHLYRGVRVTNADGFTNPSSDSTYSFRWDGQTGLRKNACRWLVTIQQLLHTNQGRVLLAMAARIIVTAASGLYRWHQNW